jgi:hypothetical protein
MKAKLALDFYIPKNKPRQMLFRLLKRRSVKRKLQLSLDNLVAVVSTLKLPG